MNITSFPVDAASEAVSVDLVSENCSKNSSKDLEFLGAGTSGANPVHKP